MAVSCPQNAMSANKVWLLILALLALAWLSFAAWLIAWPPTWLSLPVFLFLGYAFFRFAFELILNRDQVPTMATCFVARRKMAELLEKDAQARPQAPYNVVDLGAGRGELARLIAKKIPRAQVLGLELAFFPYWQAVLIQRLLGPPNLSFKRQDIWNFDCSNADAIVLYLGPLTAQRMGEKLRKEMKAERLVLSFSYPLSGDWEPTEVVALRSPFKETLYAYKSS